MRKKHHNTALLKPLGCFQHESDQETEWPVRLLTFRGGDERVNDDLQHEVSEVCFNQSLEDQYLSTVKEVSELHSTMLACHICENTCTQTWASQIGRMSGRSQLTPYSN